MENQSSGKSTQTTYTVNSISYEPSKVNCLRACQTITHIDVDEKSPDRIVGLLGYTPYSKIKEECLNIYDIPKRNILFLDETLSDYSDVVRNSEELPRKSSQSNVMKSTIKKEGMSSKRTYEKKIEDHGVQTSLMVYPHILENDSLPLVSLTSETQTDTSFSPDAAESIINAVLCAIEGHSSDSSRDENTSTKNEQGVSVDKSSSFLLEPMFQETSTIRMVSKVDTTLSGAFEKMRTSVDETAKKLEDQLERMIRECNLTEPIEKFQNKEIQSSTMADHIVSGDCRGYKNARIACECDCTGGAGGATPLLENHAPNNISAELLIGRKRKDDKTKSMPDLNERNIRLPLMGELRRQYCRCHCAKSDTTHKCAGFMADKTIKPKTSTTHGTDLLVEQDGNYIDSYLELLAEDNVGTQTELSDITGEDSVYSFNTPKERCTCTRNIEMPWDEITYNPRQKQKPQKSEPIVKEVVEVIQSPSIVKLKELTVDAMDAEALFELTTDAIADKIGDEDLDLEQIECQILEEMNIDVDHMSDDVSEKEKTPRLPTGKPKPRLVYDPDCERHNEPYMDRMFSYFPDECDTMDACPSSIEMPWKSILLPKKCNIRKQYKPPQHDKKDVGNHDKTTTSFKDCLSPSKTTMGFDIKFSIPDISSKMFPVENAAQDQISISTTISNVTYKPKRAQKSYTIKGSFSQPFMPQNQPITVNPSATKCSCTAKDSDLMRVLNFTDPKCAKNSPPKSNNMKFFTSMPSINSKSSIKKTGDSEPKKTNKSDRIAGLLESCKKEMEPIKDGINKLRSRIRELNLPDITSYQEIPGVPSAYPGIPFSCVPSYGSLGGSRPYCQPMNSYWPSYVPYGPPCHLPPCYRPPIPGQHTYITRKLRKKAKGSNPTRTKSSSATSSGTEYSDSEVCPASQKNGTDISTDSCMSVICKAHTPTIQKKDRPSKIPKRINPSDVNPETTGVSKTVKICSEGIVPSKLDLQVRTEKTTPKESAAENICSSKIKSGTVEIVKETTSCSTAISDADKIPVHVTYTSMKRQESTKNSYTLSSKVRIQMIKVRDSKYKKTTRDVASSISEHNKNPGCTSSMFLNSQPSSSKCSKSRPPKSEGCKY